MKIVEEIETNKDEETEDDFIEETDTLLIATCAICNKQEHISQEMMKFLSDITFRLNPESRAARIQEALNFVIGNKCTDNQPHAFIFDEEWIQTVNKTALIILEENEKYSKNLDKKHELENTINQLNNKLTRLNNENNELLIKIPELTKTFERMTETKNYKAWI